MLFLDSASDPHAAGALAHVTQGRAVFDDERACFFGVTCDPRDVAAGRIAQQLPGIRFFLDFDRAVSTAFGVERSGRHTAQWLLLDPALRLLGFFPVNEGGQALAQLQVALDSPVADQWAPVLMVPNILPSELCTELIRGYAANGGNDSGFMRDVAGKTVLLLDPYLKQRRDWNIEDESLKQRIIRHINRHLTVPIQRAFQFTPTRVERYLVACYKAGAGHFRQHRDNTTKGTAHRKFAVTINLNADEYDGGDLRFPEFGQRTYRAPSGGAIVFSCSLLHEALPVSRGRRYAFLPFLYDEAAAALRETNNPYLGDGLEPYSHTQRKV